MCITPPTPPQATPAPQKTDADIARAAEEERRRLGLSQNGYSSNFKPIGMNGQGAEPPPLKKIVLGA